MKMITQRARLLRRNETAPEKALKFWLRDRRMLGWKFRRQHPLPPYFIDWACIELKLGFELDGAGHQDQLEYDQLRDKRLRRRKWKIIRIGNDEIILRCEAVLERIVFEVDARARELGLSPHPDPLPARGEGER